MSVAIELADVMVIDDPWRYRNWSDTARGAAKAHYLGLKFEELRALTPTISALRKKDSVVVMWTTWPKLDQGVDLIRHRGWTYVTGFPWIKVSPSSGDIKRGVGFWSMGASEVVLIGRTGKTLKQSKLAGGNVLGLLCGSQRQFYDRIGKHSRKPYGIAEWLEEKFKGATFMELFATEQRPGWICHGHRMGTHICADGVIPLQEAIMRGMLPEDYDPFHEPIRKKKAKKDQTAGYQEEIARQGEQLRFGKGYMGICPECDVAWVKGEGEPDITFPDELQPALGYHTICWNKRNRKAELVIPALVDHLDAAIMGF